MSYERFTVILRGLTRQKQLECLHESLCVTLGTSEILNWEKVFLSGASLLSGLAALWAAAPEEDGRATVSVGRRCNSVKQLCGWRPQNGEQHGRERRFGHVGKHGIVSTCEASMPLIYTTCCHWVSLPQRTPPFFF